MSSEDIKKNWTAHLPGILTGSAALVAALTTVFINLRNDKSGSPASAQAISVSAAATPGTSIPAAQTPAALSQSMELRLTRLRVDNDGTMGSTDWTFDIQAGGRSMFSVPFKSLSDKPGSNLVTPVDPALANIKLVLQSNKSAEIIVRGWKQGWVGKAVSPDVIGQAQLNAGDNALVIEAKSEKSHGPAFVLYFDTRVLKTN